MTQVRIERQEHSENYRSFDCGLNFRLTPADSLNLGVWTTTLAGHRWTQLTLANVYSLSKRTKAYVDVMFERASSRTVADTLGIGPSSSGRETIILAGVHHAF